MLARARKQVRCNATLSITTIPVFHEQPSRDHRPAWFTGIPLLRPQTHFVSLPLSSKLNGRPTPLTRSVQSLVSSNCSRLPLPIAPTLPYGKREKKEKNYMTEGPKLGLETIPREYPGSRRRQQGRSVGGEGVVVRPLPGFCLYG